MSTLLFFSLSNKNTEKKPIVLDFRMNENIKLKAYYLEGYSKIYL